MAPPLLSMRAVTMIAAVPSVMECAGTRVWSSNGNLRPRSATAAGQDCAADREFTDSNNGVLPWLKTQW
jgi:hypothetical protein